MTQETTSSSPDLSSEPVLVLDEAAIRHALLRIAHEIVEQHRDLAKLVLIGVPSRGVEISKRLADYIENIEGIRPELGIIDVSMHRDDLQLRATPPIMQPSHLPVDLDERQVVLIDDVFFTGRTARAAMDAILSFGRPSRIQLAVLVDRGHRELPIQPDFTGKRISTDRMERVRVRLSSVDQEPDTVRICKP